ncbi:MAG: LysR substrate-binding domain-containing protein [Rhodospirillales bacterium]
MALNSRQIEAFRAVMLTGTMVQAANALYISQPAVSRLIADLERDLGYLLFNRTRGRLQPTEEGNALYVEVQRSFVGLAQVETAARAIGRDSSGVLRMAVMPSLSGEPLTRAISNYARDNPDVAFEIEVRPRRQVIESIAAQQYDIGVTTLPSDMPGIEILQLSEGNALCVLPKDHPLATRSVIHARDLEGESFVSFPNDTLFRIRVDRIFDELKVPRRMRFEVRTAEIACNLVAEGAGVSIVGTWEVPASKRKGLVMRRFEPALTIKIGALVPAHRPSSRRVETFIRALARSFEDCAGSETDLAL